MADDQWGKDAGYILGLGHGPVLLNPCPAPDRLDEIISNGVIVGAISFSSSTLRSTLILKKEGGILYRKAGLKPEKGYVVSDLSAIPFLLDEKNLLSPGIIGCSEGVKPGDEVLVVDPEMNVIGSGSSRKYTDEMVGTKGMGVKMRWALPSPEVPGKGQKFEEISFEDIWDHVIDVNRKILDHKIRTAVRFITTLVNKEKIPAAVSFSGGKDSLATLLLTMDAGLELPIMFIDTGIEFPETVEHVYSLAEQLGLKLLVGRPNSSFFDNLEKFGPPGRDYRWCCKSSKLGPITQLIRENYPEGVLTFIGQRRFESDTREKKGAVWKNPWVPLQKGASPVQEWTALDIWLYIFSHKVPYNPLYEKGFQRIGCWLCPSCDLAESSLVDETGVDTEPFRSFLESEKNRRGLPDEWLDHGFHRFKRPPPHMQRLASELGMEKELLFGSGKRIKRNDLVEMVDGFGSCIDGMSQEGVFGKDVDWERTVSLMNILGEVVFIKGTKGFEVRPPGWKMKRAALEMYPDGTLVIRGGDERTLEEVRKKMISILKRASACVGCMICSGRCPHSAIYLDDEGKILIDDKICKHCSACLGPCPAESFEKDPYDN